MAQAFPSTPQIIYDTVSTDATIVSYLGEYTFGSTPNSVPAVSIVTPGADLPNIKTVSGVEIIIHDVADMRRRDYLTDSPDLETTWNVFVVCWEPATGDQVTAVVRRMMEIFSGATSFQTVATADGIGAMVQTQVMIPSDKPILT